MPKTFENPLLSHNRMRALYRGIVELRALKAVPRNLEACYAASAIGLDENDFAATAAGEYIQALGARPGNGATRKLPPLGEHPTASALEQALCGVGAAAALQHLGGVALIYVESLRPADWSRILSLASALPLILVALPGTRVDLHKIASKAGGIPVIPVDAADAVALYRVAQECMVRARTDHQPALIECIPSPQDPLKLLGDQLVAKKIVTIDWLRATEKSFAALLPSRRKVH